MKTRNLLITCGVIAGACLVAYLLRRPAPEAAHVALPAAPLEVAQTNLVRIDGQMRMKGLATPFTGFMLEHHVDGSLRSRSAISNGVLHGLSTGWYTNGQMQVMESFKGGVSDGVRTKWYASGAKQSEAHIVQGKMEGTYRKWHENGNLSEQIEFVADKPEGLSVSRFPSGSLKARVLMKDGKPVEQRFWSDGESKE